MHDVTGRKTSILLVIDCEPDVRETLLGRPDPWFGFERLFDFLSAQRTLLSARTGVSTRFAWFWRMDPQIDLTYGHADWAIRTYGSQIADARRCGDEVGVHVHAWRWEAALCRWISDHGDRSWVEHCVRTSLTEFERAFGEPCRIFRFGDGWLDNSTVALIESLGVHIDLTLEPGGEETPCLAPNELSTGFIPDRRKVPARPYHPSRADFRKPDRRGDSRLWMLPVSTAHLQPPLPFLRRFLRPAAQNRPVSQLNLGLEPRDFLHVFNQAVSREACSYVAICVRTDVGSNEGLMSRVQENLFGILDHRLAKQFVFTSPAAALASFVG